MANFQPEPGVSHAPLRVVLCFLLLVTTGACGRGGGEPDGPTAEDLCKRGKAHLDKGEADGAITAFTGALKLDPKFVDAHAGLSAAYNIKGDHDRAIAAADAALAIDRDCVPAYAFRGLARQQKGDMEAALENFNDVMRRKPAPALEAVVRLNRSAVCNEVGLHQQAVKDANRSLFLSPRNSKAYNNLGDALTALRRLDEARQAFDAAIELSPQDPTPRLNRGKMHYAAGADDLAVKDYEEVIRLQPKGPDAALAYYNWGQVHLHKKQRPDPAIECFTKTIEMVPNHPQAHLQRGTAYFDKKEYEKAIEDFKKAIALDENYLLAYQNLAVAYREAGKSQEARQALVEYRKRQNALKIPRKLDPIPPD